VTICAIMYLCRTFSSLKCTRLVHSGTNRVVAPELWHKEGLFPCVVHEFTIFTNSFRASSESLNLWNNCNLILCIDLNAHSFCLISYSSRNNLRYNNNLEVLVNCQLRVFPVRFNFWVCLKPDSLIRFQPPVTQSCLQRRLRPFLSLLSAKSSLNWSNLLKLLKVRGLCTCAWVWNMP